MRSQPYQDGRLHAMASAPTSRTFTSLAVDDRTLRSSAIMSLSSVTELFIAGEVVLLAGAVVACGCWMMDRTCDHISRWSERLHRWWKATSPWLALLWRVLCVSSVVAMATFRSSRPPRAVPDLRYDDPCVNYTAHTNLANGLQANLENFEGISNELHTAPRDLVPNYLELYTIKSSLDASFTSIRDDLLPAWIAAMEGNGQDVHAAQEAVDQAFRSTVWHGTRCNNRADSVEKYMGDVFRVVGDARAQVTRERQRRGWRSIWTAAEDGFAAQMDLFSLPLAEERLQTANDFLDVMESSVVDRARLCKMSELDMSRAVWEEAKEGVHGTGGNERRRKLQELDERRGGWGCGRATT